MYISSQRSQGQSRCSCHAILARVAQYWIEDPGALRAALDGALRQPPAVADPNSWVDELDLAKIERREFEVTIDPNLTIEQMVAAGEYTFVNPNHTTAIFGPCRKVTGDKPVKAKVVAFCIGRKATSKQAKRLRARLGLGEICIQHELALGAQHKSAQQKLSWIVNVDDEVLAVGLRYVSYLCGDAAYRALSLDDAGGEWRDSIWFLGLFSEV